MATTYDFVTVGGGIGGAALAERGAHVLVLEHETSSKTVSIARDSYPGGRRSPQIRFCKRSAEMASFNGHATARGVARLFATLACGGKLDGVRLLSKTMLDDALTEQWQQTDPLGLPCRMSMGFMLRNDALVPYNDNPRSFGHIGLGGALAFGDPDAKLGFSFCGNRMASIAIGPYVKRLLAATMGAL